MTRLMLVTVCVLSLVAGSVWAAKPVKTEKPGQPVKEEGLKPTPEARSAMHAELRALQQSFHEQQRLAHQQCREDQGLLQEGYRADRQAIIDRYHAVPVPEPLPVEPLPVEPMPVEPPVPSVP